MEIVDVIDCAFLQPKKKKKFNYMNPNEDLINFNFHKDQDSILQDQDE